ncbi:MAG: AIPR family protein [Sphingomicrobium sp.]|nr:AIPR family protein [Sphingomonadales bacterium]
MTHLDGAPLRAIFEYNSLRNISSPDDVENGRRVYAGHAGGTAFLQLPENENVRGYLVTAEGKQRQRLSDVHRQIRDTLENKPQDFCILNGGIVIVAAAADVEEKQKTVTLVSPSIINGSQTRGELARYYKHCTARDIMPHPVFVKFEIVVAEDDDLKAEISIARNFQNDVARLSIAGRRGQLDELETRLQEVRPDLKLRKSETERSNDFADTEKVLQVCTALMPVEIWPKPKEKDDPIKVYTYSMKSKCLREFQDIHRKAKSPSSEELQNGEAAKATDLYQYYLDVAPQALELYERWKKHQGFKGTGLRSIGRDESKNVTDVPDGIVFPIIASLSAFVRKIDGRWAYAPPAKFHDVDIIKAAKGQYINTVGSNPWNMGKSRAVYSSLFQITNIYKDLSE